jgi:hypothetical protein
MNALVFSIPKILSIFGTAADAFIDIVFLYFWGWEKNIRDSERCQPNDFFGLTPRSICAIASLLMIYSSFSFVIFTKGAIE